MTGHAEDPLLHRQPTFQALPRWLEQVVGRLVIAERLRTANVDPQTMMGLMQRDASSIARAARARPTAGASQPAEASTSIRSFVTPMVLMMLMFMIVISTASPLLNSVMEEKMTRISEVLLGSVTPFELMMGKLLGVIGVSLVLVGDLPLGRLRRSRSTTATATP